MTRLVKSVPARALLNYTRPWTSSLLSSIVKMNILFTRVQSEFWAFHADRLDCVSASCPRSCVRKGCKFSSIVGCKKDYETVQMDIHSFASKCNAQTSLGTTLLTRQVVQDANNSTVCDVGSVEVPHRTERNPLRSDLVIRQIKFKCRRDVIAYALSRSSAEIKVYTIAVH